MLSIRRALSILAGITVGIAFTAAIGSSATTAQVICDPNYGATSTGQCVPGDRDYDCPELKARGIGDIPVIGDDWQRLDGYQDFSTGEWLSYPDGLGCEWYGE
jgi:hypothetical protein